MARIQEPMTMITDFILGSFALYFGSSLLSFSHISAKFLGLSIIITGISAILGGVYHGFQEFFSEKRKNVVWETTLIGIGISTVLFIYANLLSIEILLPIRLTLLSLAIFGWFILIKRIHSTMEFFDVIIFYSLSMVLVLGLKIFTFYSANDPSSVLIILGILVTFVGSGFQARKIGFHPKYFNHNDLFHIIQMLSVYLFYLAGINFQF